MTSVAASQRSRERALAFPSLLFRMPAGHDRAAGRGRTDLFYAVSDERASTRRKREDRARDEQAAEDALAGRVGGVERGDGALRLGQRGPGAINGLDDDLDGGLGRHKSEGMNHG